MQIIIYASIGVAFLTGIISWLGANIRAARNVADRELAFQIAEAGIDYYRWHLAHDRNDFQDGASGAGPYVHSFLNAAGERVGEFRLTITPPLSGGTTVGVVSEGKVDANDRIRREIETKLAISSYAKYAVLANDKMRFGAQALIEGLVHSNNGIRYDGIAKNMVTSAKDTYSDPDHEGGAEYAVHTHVSPLDPSPPAELPIRPDVFRAGRQMSLPAVDFAGITADLASLKAAAETGGRYFANSGALGYHVVLKTNDTFSLYKVTALRPGNRRSGCYTNENPAPPGWSTWTITTEEYLADYPFPANGILFFEDHTWVNGKIDGARLTIAAGQFPEAPGQYRNIIVNNDLTYTNYDSRDVLGLIAQGDFNVGVESADILRIDAAVIAQNGRAGRFYYLGPDDRGSRCSPYHIRQKLTLFGSLATNKRYGFTWSDGTGYQSVNIVYDANLLYNPPPLFPLTSDQYETISWEDTTFAE